MCVFLISRRIYYVLNFAFKENAFAAVGFCGWACLMPLGHSTHVYKETTEELTQRDRAPKSVTWDTNVRNQRLLWTMITLKEIITFPSILEVLSTVEFKNVEIKI
jgi:hypothetical protein